MNGIRKNENLRNASIRRHRPLWLKRLHDFWRAYKRNKAAVTGLLIVVFFFAIATGASIISPYDPMKVMAGKPFKEPRAPYYFGTDDLGRDVFSGVVYGARISLMVGLLAAMSSTLIGIVVGSISGYVGGRIDDVLMRITEFFMILPTFFLALLIVSFFGFSILNIIFAISIVTWTGTAKLVRAAFLSLKEKEFVEAARAIGLSDLAIIFREILPNAMVVAIVNGSFQVANAILLEAGLSFLGAGDPSIPSWGKMLANAQTFLRRAWWMAVFPGLSILFLALGLNLVGDGLNDVLNPRIK